MIQRCWRLIPCSLLIIGLIGIAALSFLATGSAQADTFAQHVSHLSAHLDSSTGHATVIVLDMSGSMGQNDPNGYRCSAADSYIDLSGTNDYIGLVGLDNNSGFRSGSNNFQAAQSWTNPLSTATVQDKQKLKDIIASQSNNCRPDANTPTFDSLSQAYIMLGQITRQTGESGSVILLTDGVPCPDVDGQINAITSGLLPEFQKQGWRIDTIGLGSDAPIASGNGCTAPGTLPGTFHDFLRNISNATGGHFYDDGTGPIQGVSPLNIAAFFVDIFASYSGLTPHLDIPPTALGGGTQQLNFNVIDGSTVLDVVAIKDNPAVTMTLFNPNSQPISSNDAGVFASRDNYHFIYSITTPQPGPWIVSVGGTGEFMLYSLQKNAIGLGIDSVSLENSTIVASASTALPLGQPLQVKAHLTNNGQPFSDTNYTLNASIAPPGVSQDCAHPIASFPLSGNAGIYTGTVSIPTTNPAGSYNVLVCASTGTLQNVVASQTIPVRLEVFPIPSFLSSKTNQPTTDTINKSVVQWWEPLPTIYSLPAVSLLSGWPLLGYPAQPYILLPGEVQWNGQPYLGASITATSSLVKTCNPNTVTSKSGPIPVQITQGSNGNFEAQIYPPSTGLYEIVFQTSGTFKDSQGSFGPTVRCLYAVVAPPTYDQGLHAFSVTVIYLAILAFLIFLVRFWATPRPYGQWVRDIGSVSESNRSFVNAHRVNPLQWFFKRNYLYSRQAGMPRGLEIRFRWGKRIDVRPSGAGRSEWQLPNGRKLSLRFQRARELVHRPPGVDAGDLSAQTRFTIMTSKSRRQGGSGYDGFGSYSEKTGRNTKQKSVLNDWLNGRSTRNPKQKDKHGQRTDTLPWNKY